VTAAAEAGGATTDRERMTGDGGGCFGAVLD